MSCKFCLILLISIIYYTNVISQTKLNVVDEINGFIDEFYMEYGYDKANEFIQFDTVIVSNGLSFLKEYKIDTNIFNNCVSIMHSSIKDRSKKNEEMVFVEIYIYNDKDMANCVKYRLDSLSNFNLHYYPDYIDTILNDNNSNIVTSFLPEYLLYKNVILVSFIKPNDITKRFLDFIMNKYINFEDQFIGRPRKPKECP